MLALRWLLRAVIVATLGFGWLTAVPQSAQAAWPTGCWHGVWTEYAAQAACSRSNGGQYRAIAVCKPWGSSKKYWRYGPWKSAGTSIAYCQGTETISYSGIETRP